jgi:hypothetical protein
MVPEVVLVTTAEEADDPEDAAGVVVLPAVVVDVEELVRAVVSPVTEEEAVEAGVADEEEVVRDCVVLASVDEE